MADASVTVWFDAWQLVVGHDGFGVADVVTWPVTAPGPGGDRSTGSGAPVSPDLLVQFYASSSPVSVLTGTVQAIERATAPVGHVLRSTTSGRAAPVAWNVCSVADTRAWDDRGSASWFCGYVVTLVDVELP